MPFWYLPLLRLFPLRIYDAVVVRIFPHRKNPVLATETTDIKISFAK